MNLQPTRKVYLADRLGVGLGGNGGSRCRTRYRYCVNLLKEELGKGLRDVRLFDVYEGKGIDSDKKSLALSLTFESQTATLTEEEIVEYADKSLNALRREFKAELR